MSKKNIKNKLSKNDSKSNLLLGSLLVLFSLVIVFFYHSFKVKAELSKENQISIVSKSTQSSSSSKNFEKIAKELTTPIAKLSSSEIAQLTELKKEQKVEKASTEKSSSKAAAPTATTETAPVASQEKAATPAPLPTPVATTQPSTITIGGQTTNYQNGGQSAGQAIIDANPNGNVSTWGGAAVFSGTDGLSTHFIGHSPGVFSVALYQQVGSTITVTDANGTAYNYVVTEARDVNEYAEDINTGEDLYDRITTAGGGEQIVIQTCTSTTGRRILFAAAA